LPEILHFLVVFLIEIAMKKVSN